MNYIYSSDQITKAALAVFDTINSHLSQDERVLWLVSGGSGIPIAVMVSEMLQNININNLSVTLTDERYGPIGHKNENWQQLLNTGFKLPGANLYRPIIGKDIEITTTEFNNWLFDQFDRAHYSIGIFGIGTDGHTAGIKPHSPAISSADLAISYQGDDFQRITATVNSVKQLDEVVIQASNTEKMPVLHNLLYDDIPIDQQPAQVLKLVPYVTIYSNNKKEEI